MQVVLPYPLVDVTAVIGLKQNVDQKILMVPVVRKGHAVRKGYADLSLGESAAISHMYQYSLERMDLTILPMSKL